MKVRIRLGNSLINVSIKLGKLIDYIRVGKLINIIIIRLGKLIDKVSCGVG